MPRKHDPQDGRFTDAHRRKLARWRDQHGEPTPKPPLASGYSYFTKRGEVVPEGHVWGVSVYAVGPDLADVFQPGDVAIVRRCEAVVGSVVFATDPEGRSRIVRTYALREGWRLGGPVIAVQRPVT